ncbi:ankyrin repeat domain-containing protein 34B-like [Branchiostoma lanceolatum]|uniref:ankyrin repeat domain-containing protein 34B-like n=1 Tax=Branchiostoma lanceolatum TaxID=7740 RepID=UPI0034538459
MSLNTALSAGRYRHFRYLLGAGADVNSRGADGTTPLMLCCHLPNEHVAYRAACCLLRRGADVGTKDRAGRNALLHACVTGRRANIELFLQPGCLDYDLNDTDKSGNTALHYTVVFGNPEIVQLVVTVLKKYNLRLHIRNNSGLTPYCLAIKKGLKECADMISPVMQVNPPTQESVSRASSCEPVRRLCRVESAREGIQKHPDLELLRGKDVVFMDSSPLWDMRKSREAFLAQKNPTRKTSAGKKTRNDSPVRAVDRKGSETTSADRVRQLLHIQAMDRLPTFRKAAVPPTDLDTWGRPLGTPISEETPSNDQNILKVFSLLASKASVPPSRAESEPNLLKGWKRSAFVSRRRTYSTSTSQSGTQRSGSDRPASDAAGTRSRRLVRDVFSSASNVNDVKSTS